MVAAYPHPDQWQWILACDEVSWSQLIQHIGYDSSAKNVMALTDLQHHITYVRARPMLTPAMGDEFTPEHVIAHELAHIWSN